MYGGAVGQGDDAQYPTAMFVYLTPKPHTIVSLHFGAQWIFNHANAPFPPQIRPPPGHAFSEVIGESIPSHKTNFFSAGSKLS